MDTPILLVDDEIDFLDTIKRGLVISGYGNVSTANDPESALVMFEQGRQFDIALIDITMPKMNGILLLEKIKALSPHTECIMVTAVNETQTAVTAIKKGAYDYLVKPISKDDLLVSLNRALERKRFMDIMGVRGKGGLEPLDHPRAFSQIITRSPLVLQVLREAELHASSNVPVLITGESGTGKELLARAVHQASPRADFLFSAINMASMSSSLFDAEFFGHTKGAFTGAQAERKGYLTTTDRGSLFLDEIGSLAPELQGKLLRVLQEGEHLQIGTDTPIKTDIRFIAATNENIDKQVGLNKFRKDLYYRLKGAWLHLPPLRDRMEDLPLLVNHLLEKLSPAGHVKIHPEAMVVLSNHSYPGNIRELQSVLHSAVNLSQGGTILPDHLPETFKNATFKPILQGKSGFRSLSLVEKEHILHVYGQTRENKTRTASILGIGINTLRRKLKSFGMS